MYTFAQPIDSGVYQKIQAELLIPDPEISVAMEIINEPKSNVHNHESDQQDRP